MLMNKVPIFLLVLIGFVHCKKQIGEVCTNDDGFFVDCEEGLKCKRRGEDYVCIDENLAEAPLTRIRILDLGESLQPIQNEQVAVHKKNKIGERCSTDDELLEDCEDGLTCKLKNETYVCVDENLAEPGAVCGGLFHFGPSKCPTSYECKKKAKHHRLFYCLELSITTMTSITITTNSDIQMEPYGRCGGWGYRGPRNCLDGHVCKKRKMTDWYHVCVPITTSSAYLETTTARAEEAEVTQSENTAAQSIEDTTPETIEQTTTTEAEEAEVAPSENTTSMSIEVDREVEQTTEEQSTTVEINNETTSENIAEVATTESLPVESEQPSTQTIEQTTEQPATPKELTNDYVLATNAPKTNPATTSTESSTTKLKTLPTRRRKTTAFSYSTSTSSASA